MKTNPSRLGALLLALTLALVACGVLSVLVPPSLPAGAAVVPEPPRLGPFDVKAYGARGDGVTDDYAAIMRAVAAAKAAGKIRFGGTVYFPTGRYMTSRPIELPRNGATPSNVVWLAGDNPRTSVIEGTAGFAGSGVVKWETLADVSSGKGRVWFGYIGNLGITAPNVANVRAIHFNQSQGTINNATQASNEWYDVDLDHIEINCHNDYHPDLIRVDTAVRFSHWQDVTGNPVLGNGTYATRLISTRYQFDDGSYAGFRNDSIGIGSCVLENINPMTITGGWCESFKGRMYMSTWTTGFSNGAHSKHLPSAAYHFIDSYDNVLNALGSEGNADTHILLEKCQNNEFNNPAFGTVRPRYNGWAAATAYAVGDRVVSTAMLNGNPQATANLYFACTVGGTSGGTQPTWPTVAGNTVTDGTVTWQAAGPAVGEEVTLIECKANRFHNRALDPASGISSFRATRAVSIDSLSFDNVFENWSLRTAPANAADGSDRAINEVSLPSDDNRNHLSGMAVSVGVRIPYQLGSHPHRPTRTATLDFGSIAAGASATLTISVPGAVPGDQVLLTPPSNFSAGLTVRGYSLSSNNVTVQAFNPTGSPIDPPSGTWRAMALKP
jgi:hypothetical protein